MYTSLATRQRISDQYNRHVSQSQKYLTSAIFLARKIHGEYSPGETHASLLSSDGGVAATMMRCKAAGWPWYLNESRNCRITFCKHGLWIKFIDTHIDTTVDTTDGNFVIRVVIEFQVSEAIMIPAILSRERRVCTMILARVTFKYRHCDLRVAMRN